MLSSADFCRESDRLPVWPPGSEVTDGTTTSSGSVVRQISAASGQRGRTGNPCGRPSWRGGAGDLA